MTGQELLSIRAALGLSGDKFGAMLGYQGPNVRKIIWALENGTRSITPQIEKLAIAYRDGYMPMQE